MPHGGSRESRLEDARGRQVSLHCWESDHQGEHGDRRSQLNAYVTQRRGPLRHVLVVHNRVRKSIWASANGSIGLTSDGLGEKQLTNKQICSFSPHQPCFVYLGESK